jgi:hypothetical protein
MRKTDQSIKNLVTAAIKRHAMNLETWDHTKLWDSLNDTVRSAITERVDLADGELGIIAYYESEDYWYVITTRGLAVWQAGQIHSTPIDKVDSYSVGDFKGILTKRKTDTMQLRHEGRVMTAFRYETGEPSMGAIYGIMTLLSVGRD